MSLTELTDRVVWFDGTNQVHPDMVPELFLYGLQPENIAVTELSADIKRFNKLSDTIISHTKNVNSAFSYDWNVPDEYLNIDLSSFAHAKLASLRDRKKIDELMFARYVDRLNKEIDLVIKLDMLNIFNTLIYVIDVLKNNNILWGVGRGSSCASLILYLIGVHIVDPVRYNIDINEFFRD